jgi:TIR domain
MIDGFISHSSSNRSTALRLEKALEADGLSVWLDESEIRLGELLGKELQDSIRGARVFVLLWSEAAAASRWVITEWLTAYHVGRFIIPCSLDATPLPQCLQTAIRLKIGSVTKGVVDDLARGIRQSPSSPNRLAPAMSAQSPEASTAISRIAAAQDGIHDAISKGGLAKARREQARLNREVAHTLKKWPLDPVLVNLAGYQLKNEYMLAHWDAIQAGRGPRDPLLEQSEKRFFETLSLDPTDPGALNGLGNVLFFRRDLNAAEFFHIAAAAQAKKQGFDYPAAEHDLELVRRFSSPTMAPALTPDGT